MKKDLTQINLDLIDGVGVQRTEEGFALCIMQQGSMLALNVYKRKEDVKLDADDLFEIIASRKKVNS